jgi:predicted nuclease of predicted toxin-antitoxin system
MKPYKWRLYADNNIEREIVEHLREKEKMDVLYVRDDPKLRAQEDPFHYQDARKLGRYLLTHDEDFWNDQQYPLHTCPGLIILPKNSESIAKYFPALLRTLMDYYNPLPEAIHLNEVKIRLTWESITIKMIDHDTQKKTTETWTWEELGLKGKA